MMYGPIQQLPPGLLGFLQLKSQGQNPSLLADSYQPSIEMLDWLLLASNETLQVGFAAGTIGGNLASSTVNAVATVPNEEWWYVHRFSVGVAPVGATRISNVGLIMTLSAAGAAANFSLASNPVIGVADLVNVGAQGFFAPPGAILGWIANITNAGATNVAGSALWFTRLPT